MVGTRSALIMIKNLLALGEQFSYDRYEPYRIPNGEFPATGPHRDPDDEGVGTRSALACARVAPRPGPIAIITTRGMGTLPRVTSLRARAGAR